METKSKKKQPNPGFTLIELLVVVAIMGSLVGFMIINLGQQRGARNLKIAQNQLVTDLRKIQSYTLSSRVLPNGQPVQYYLMKFDLSKPDQYSIQGIYDKENTTNGRLKHVEVVHLPQEVTFDPLSPVVTSNPALNGNTKNCFLIAFKAPFARVLVNRGCDQVAPVGDPYLIDNTDDYSKIVNFYSDTGVTSNSSVVVLKLKEARTGTTKTVTIQAVNGLITFEQ
ncbi:MAG: type II secretion system GspH family protein [Patescibacteria group bacterium]|nr:type II secretion system GspH family protein [Patescibacteria group bacterium]